MTWPILLGAARVMAQSRVIAIVAGERGKLAEQVLRVEHRDIEGGWHGLFGNGELPPRQAKLLGAASHVIGVVGRDADVWSGNVQRLAPEAEVLGLEPAGRGSHGRHAAEILIRQLEAAPPLQAGATGILESIAKTGLAPRLVDNGGPALLHVGSGSSDKNWPIENWLGLAASLKKSGRRVRFILGEAEVERLSSKQMASLTDAGDVQRPKDLAELYFLFRGCGLYVGGDTGPTHLAAVAGLPTLALFGPASDVTTWRPVGPAVQVLATDDLAKLPVQRVAKLLIE